MDSHAQLTAASLRAGCLTSLGSLLQVFWRLRSAALLLATRVSAATLLLTLLASAVPAAIAFDATRLKSAAATLGPRGERVANELQDAINRSSRVDDKARLELINRFFNRSITFVNDHEAWGENDYWASPLETLVKGAGDCEDYAIGKFFALQAAGLPAAKLRLVYVRAMMPGIGSQPAASQAHMVLAYYADPAAEPMILDNLIPDIRLASQRPDLTPVFSFNAEGLWNGAGPQKAGNPQARLSRWRDVLRKAQAEGFE
jgi:predicted transglutaminase-like cysteine proteinase